MTASDGGTIDHESMAGGSAVPARLRLVPLPPVQEPSFALTHPYVEMVYANMLGPSAVLLLRAFGRALGSAGQAVTVCPQALSRELGLTSTTSESPLGRRARLRRAIERLEHERLVRWRSDVELAVHIRAPALSDRALRRLPPQARRAHDHFTGSSVIDLRDHAAGQSPP